VSVTVYWLNPFAWVYRALVVNEFRSERWQQANASDLILKNAGFIDPSGAPFGTEWIWYAFAYMIPFAVLCGCIASLILTYVRGGGSSSSDEPSLNTDEENKQAKRIEIPFQPVTLSFRDVCYTVKASTSSETLSLLKNVNGVFEPGRMVGLMGSSGAGKTTLLDVIALRKSTGTVTGEVCLNGWPQDPVSFRRCSGYCEQFDVQSPELTVRETILFSARLRLDPDLCSCDDNVQLFVDQVIRDVNLTLLADVQVGTDETYGLSFEQKKRLSIAVELAASPSVIFLDEPTSGLDSRSAMLVVRALRNIANTGRTVRKAITTMLRCAMFC
jgi:ABC-type lipoprotein export system ATPase subunit